jgi:hypothetical protein
VFQVSSSPIRPFTLVLLHLLLQNGIYLPGQRDSLLYIYSSRIRHPSFLSFISTTHARTHSSASPLSFYPLTGHLPPIPLSLSHSATSSPPSAGVLPGAGCSRDRARARGRRPCSPCGGRRRGGFKGFARIHTRTGWIHGGSTDLELVGGVGRRWEQGGAAVGARRHVGGAGHAG